MTNYVKKDIKSFCAWKMPCHYPTSKEQKPSSLSSGLFFFKIKKHQMHLHHPFLERTPPRAYAIEASKVCRRREPQPGKKKRNVIARAVKENRRRPFTAGRRRDRRDRRHRHRRACWRRPGRWPGCWLPWVERRCRRRSRREPALVLGSW